MERVRKLKSPRAVRLTLVMVVISSLAACGEAPLTGLGQKSSDWIAEPTITTTTTVPVTIPVVVSSERLKWFNDTIVTDSLGDPEALRQEIFRRRGGDLIVQTSRAEIATLVPNLKFPSQAPYQAEYVTSQLVFEGTGEVSRDPVAGFGIWSSEPYTRSRSVAQMVTLWVSEDPEAAVEVSESGSDLSCARFATRAATSCEIIEVGETPVWLLRADNGRTLIWFDGVHRYEMFGRSFVSLDALRRMVPDMTSIVEVASAQESG